MKHEDIQYNYLDNLFQDISKNNDPYPLIIEIHPSNSCQYHCSYCFHNTKDEQPHRKAALTIENYQRLFLEMNALSVKSLSISGGGEPLTASNIGTIIKMASQSNLSIRLVTNGLLAQSNLDNLELLSELQEIRFSIDTLNFDTFSKMKSADAQMLEITLKNLKNLLAIKATNSLSVDIGVSTIVSDLNIEEIPTFAETLLNFGISELIIKCSILNSSVTDFQKRYNQLRETLLQNKDSRLVVRKFNDFKIGDNPCVISYFKVAINVVGDVYSCCLGAQPGITQGFFLGNIQEKSFATIWKESYVLRQQLLKNKSQCTVCNYTDSELNKKFFSLC